MKPFPFKPKLFTTLQSYSTATLLSDVMAGVIVGIVALPLAIAFAIASGLSPEKGIITAIIAGFVISFLGGSRVQIGGPTGAFIVIVFGVVQQYGEQGLIVATLMAGVMLLLMGLLRLGTVIKFIPYPIIVGFTAGIALTIFTTQIADVFGLRFGGAKVPGDFIGKWQLYWQYAHTINGWNTVIALASIVLIAKSGQYIKKIPGSLIVIVMMTPLVLLLRWLGVEGIDTIGDRFAIHANVPAAQVPPLSWDVIRNLFPVAVTIAILGAIESLLSASVADGAIGDRHDSNTELLAQGAANIITPFFGGMPATGAIARTMTNINNGGKTPIAGIVHALVLLLIFLFLMPLAQYIPMATLAGVLVIVAYNMSEWRSFKVLLSAPRSDVVVLLVTFLLTVLFDLTVAIQTGLLIACVLFMKRVMETTEISVISDAMLEEENADGFFPKTLPELPIGVKIYEINGPYFFGIATKFEEVAAMLGDRPHVRIIRMRKVPFIDSTGIHNLASLCRRSREEGTDIVLSEVNAVVSAALEKSGLYLLLGQKNICPDIDAALLRAREIQAQWQPETAADTAA
ncbi:MAG: sulfate permease [Neisseria sp.]|nr:sulfate permease [Neisseria sp.]